MLSLLARHNGKAVGHILFTRATFNGEPDSPMMHLLAPLAVVPEYQGVGIGGLLIQRGIEHLKAAGGKAVFVLGHATYHPRHGFEPCAGDKGYPAPYPIADEHKACWMRRHSRSATLLPAGCTHCLPKKTNLILLLLTQ